MFRLPTGDGDSLDIYPAKRRQSDRICCEYLFSLRLQWKYILMAGFRADGTIINISVLERRKLPLGTKIDEPQFKDQFSGKNPLTLILK